MSFLARLESYIEFLGKTAPTGVSLGYNSLLSRNMSSLPFGSFPDR